MMPYKSTYNLVYSYCNNKASLNCSRTCLHYEAFRASVASLRPNSCSSTRTNIIAHVSQSGDIIERQAPTFCWHQSTIYHSNVSLKTAVGKIRRNGEGQITRSRGANGFLRLRVSDQRLGWARGRRTGVRTRPSLNGNARWSWRSRGSMFTEL